MAGKYCGKRNGYTTLVNGDQVLITFFSDENVEEKGFLIHFTAVPYSSKYTFLFVLLEILYKWSISAAFSGIWYSTSVHKLIKPVE